MWVSFPTQSTGLRDGEEMAYRRQEKVVTGGNMKSSWVTKTAAIQFTNSSLYLSVIVTIRLYNKPSLNSVAYAI